MGMIGSVAHKALNQAGVMLLGVDFDRQKKLQQARDAREEWAASAPPPGNLQAAVPWLMQGVAMGDPRAAQFLSLLKAGEAPDHSPINTARGVYDYDPRAGAIKPLVEFEEKAPPAPAGWRWGANGSLEFIPNGPADPKYIAQTAGVRRDAVVSKPMPSRGGSGGGGKRQVHEMTDAELLAIATGGK